MATSSKCRRVVLESQPKSARAERRTKFLTALNDSPEVLKGECISREDMADNLPPEPDFKVTDVVFVVHGIRDKGYWTQKVARTIKKLSSGHCHGDFGLWPNWRSRSQGDEENQLQRVPLPS